MIVIGLLQKIYQESERLLGQLDSGSSRIYEITTAGTIVERTHQLRSFYEFIVQSAGQAIRLLGADDALPRK